MRPKYWGNNYTDWERISIVINKFLPIHYINTGLQAAQRQTTSGT